MNPESRTLVGLWIWRILLKGNAIKLFHMAAQINPGEISRKRQDFLSMNDFSGGSWVILWFSMAVRCVWKFHVIVMPPFLRPVFVKEQFREALAHRGLEHVTSQGPSWLLFRLFGFAILHPFFFFFKWSLHCFCFFKLLEFIWKFGFSEHGHEGKVIRQLLRGSFRTRLRGFKSQLCHFLAVWIYGSYFVPQLSHL